MSYDVYAGSKNETRRHIITVSGFMNEIIAKLLHRASNHDASKLECGEAEYFDKMTPLLENSTYGSEEYKQFLSELKPALDHHYRFNDHHPEHFENGIAGMNLIQLMEMLCDWKAATMRHSNGDIIRSIEINQQRFGYTDELKNILIKTVYNMGWDNDKG